MRAAVSMLAHRESVRVAVVSGRALEDVRALVGLPELIYAGCHGLQVLGGGLEFCHPLAARSGPDMRHVAERLAARLGRVAGVEVEDKGLSVAVHFRLAPPEQVPAIGEAVRATAAESGGCFRVCGGRKIWEVLPEVDWDKGRAVRWILSRSAEPDALPIYIGDDVSDEQAFAALPEGITVTACDAAASLARYSVPGPEGVLAFLRWLGSIRR
jgi:trehalose-phosphatase